MKTNSELKIAITIGIIMITICLLVVIFHNSSKMETEKIDIKIYKLIKDGEDTTEYKYAECSINTDEKVSIYTEYKKIFKLSDDSRITGASIMGDYKVAVGPNFLAFDEGSNKVFRSDTSGLYKYSTNMYKAIENACK